jgi:putative nucleotidyltransferase-like protein
VTGTTPSATATDFLAALLRGEAVEWSAFRMVPEEFLGACREEGLTGLIYERLRGLPEDCDWPEEVCEALARETRAQTARELLRRKELISVLNVLAAESIHPILLKGTALAYSLYDNPASRDRVDTDLLIRANDVDAVRRVMARCGYTAPTHCDGDLLFCQFPLRKADEFGLVHAFDFHWKISTQSLFADVLVFDEIVAAAIAVPALGVHARTAGPVHALLLACIHPVMHHRNAESLIWTCDVHLLASRLSDLEFDWFTELAVAKQVSAICVYQLRAARRRFGTRIPKKAISDLAAVRAREPSTAYLRPNRQWRDELISNVRGLPHWSDRLRLLREVALPGPTYMLKAYGFTPSALGAALLPILYLHRLASGGWKALAGQK